MTEYYSVTETAKIIRKALKESFPGIKFSVRSSSYSGGASINIGWTDGPTGEQVDQIAKQFEGSYFDGMQDYKGSQTSMFEGKRTRWGADFVFSNRSTSEELVTRVIDELYVEYKNNFEGREIAKPTNDDFVMGRLWNVSLFQDDWDSSNNLQSMIYIKLSETSLTETKKSEVTDSVSFLEDDGYGYGAVGKSMRLSVVQ